MNSNSISCSCCEKTYSSKISGLPERPLKISEVASLKSNSRFVFSKSLVSFSGEHFDVETEKQVTTAFVLGMESVARVVTYHLGIGWVIDSEKKVPVRDDPKNVALSLYGSKSRDVEKLDYFSKQQ